MEISQLKELINNGREIEFVYDGKKYSITYLTTGGKELISFCEFYKESIEVDNVDDLLMLTVNGETLNNIFESLLDNEIWIY